MKNFTNKDALLLRLKSAAGQWLSGQDLSRDLSISRTAVSKNIQSLRQEGYQIEAVTNRGYRLLAAPDRLFPAEIRQRLDTTVFGRQTIHYYDETDSTNNCARQLADFGAAEGTLVIAESQTAGRGRRGRLWISPPYQGIYLSMIVRPRLSPAEAPQLTLMTAVALSNAIMSQTNLAVRIKWPNDILVGDRKVAGILTELRTEMDLVDYLIIGVGVNVNTPARALRGVTDREATSIGLETGEMISRVALLDGFLKEFEVQYFLLLQQGFGAILECWKALAKIEGQMASVDVAGRKFKGQIVDVEQTGVLVMRKQSGELMRIFSGDVRLQKNK